MRRGKPDLLKAVKLDFKKNIFMEKIFLQKRERKFSIYENNEQDYYFGVYCSFL